jgi:hypothetical protein
MESCFVRSTVHHRRVRLRGGTSTSHSTRGLSSRLVRKRNLSRENCSCPIMKDRSVNCTYCTDFSSILIRLTSLLCNILLQDVLPYHDIAHPSPTFALRGHVTVFRPNPRLPAPRWRLSSTPLPCLLPARTQYRTQPRTYLLEMKTARIPFTALQTS